MRLTTVVIPARNEEDDLSTAIRSVLAQTTPLEDLEVVVVDGASSDRTPIVAKQLLDGTGLRRWAVITNHEATTPSNLNLGLEWAAGDLVVRVDARSALPKNYIEQTRAVLDRHDIAVVGGRQAARPARPGLMARSIARALNNPFANGGARYRDHRSPSGACDTAYLGVFRTEQLRAIGGWSTDFVSNQDFELCRRMSRFGQIWYEAGLPVDYKPRATLAQLFHQYRRFGRWKAIYWRRTGDRPQPRQLVLLALPAAGATAAIGVVVVAPTAAIPAAAAGLTALGIIDHVGAERSCSVVERLGSCLAMAIIGVGWWTGATQEVLSKGNTPT